MHYKKNKRLPGHQMALMKQYFHDLKVEGTRACGLYFSYICGKKMGKKHVWGFVIRKAFQDV